MVSISFLKNWLYQWRATTAKQPVSPGFLKEIGFSIHQAIKKTVDVCDIPDDLVIKIG